MKAITVASIGVFAFGILMGALNPASAMVPPIREIDDRDGADLYRWPPPDCGLDPCGDPWRPGCAREFEGAEPKEGFIRMNELWLWLGKTRLVIRSWIVLF